MHRGSLRRVLTALWGCWFVLLANEPMLLHSCPMHDGALVTVTVAGSASADATPAGHAGHGVPGARGTPASEAKASESAPADPAHHDDGGSHHCSCLGHCASAAAFALSEGKPLAWLAGIIDIDDMPVVAVPDVGRQVEHLLPFATAPPMVARA